MITDVDLDSEEAELSVFGDEEPVELEEAVFESDYEDEMLLLEDPGEDFDEDVLQVQSMPC